MFKKPGKQQDPVDESTARAIDENGAPSDEVAEAASEDSGYSIPAPQSQPASSPDDWLETSPIPASPEAPQILEPAADSAPSDPPELGDNGRTSAVAQHILAMPAEVDRLQLRLKQEFARISPLDESSAIQQQKPGPMLREVQTFLQRTIDESRGPLEVAINVKQAIETALESVHGMLDEVDAVCAALRGEIEQVEALRQFVDVLDHGAAAAAENGHEAAAPQGHQPTESESEEAEEQAPRGTGRETEYQPPAELEPVAHLMESPAFMTSESAGHGYHQAQDDSGVTEAAELDPEAHDLSYTGTFYITVKPLLGEEPFGKVWASLERVVGEGRLVASEPLVDRSGVRVTVDIGEEALTLPQLQTGIPQGKWHPIDHQNAEIIVPEEPFVLDGDPSSLA